MVDLLPSLSVMINLPSSPLEIICSIDLISLFSIAVITSSALILGDVSFKSLLVP